MASSEADFSSGIKSVSNAFDILDVVSQNSGPISLKQIAQRAQVSASKAHRYLQSLCACGLLSQAHKSGSYDLGVSAMRLGLAAVNRVDVVTRAGDGLLDFASELDVDALITVWSELGPTVVRYERCQHPSLSMVGPGVSFPIYTTATGMVFLAFMSPPLAEAVCRGEVRSTSALSGAEREAVNREIAKIKAAGYAHSNRAHFQKAHCVAAPILSIDGRIAAAVSISSNNPDVMEPDSIFMLKLLEFCKRYSIPRIGYERETLIEQKIAV